MKTWLVYKHTNTITGKSYIGQTCFSMKTRWYKHCYSAKTKPQGYFHNAITKYGTEVWASEVLEDGLQSVEAANKAEIKWIRHYDTVNNGYNLNMGGDVVTASEEVKQRMRDGTRKYRKTQKVRLVNVYTKETFYGYVGDLARANNYEPSCFSDIVAGTRRSYKGWVLDIEKNKNYTPINRYWFYHEQYGVVYKSLDEMCREFSNITSRGNLSGVISRKRKSHQGWKLLERLSINTEGK